MNLFCALGFHNYGKWKVYTFDIVSGQPTQYYRTCDICKKRKLGISKIKIVNQD